MKLFYYHAPYGNFGDDLNEWIWPRLVPGIRKKHDDTLFVGIGTILNHRVPTASRTVVFGAGYGYGRRPRIDERWDVYCVRGPLTAHAVGVDAQLGVADPAVLLRTFDLPVGEMSDVAFMPHHRSVRHVPWQLYCRLAGITYIDPRVAVEEAVGSVRGARLLLTEAMHGAIVADAYRVPWIPVRLASRINVFKWKDWCASMKLPYDPIVIDLGRKSGYVGHGRFALRASIVPLQLKRAVARKTPILSEQARLDQVVTRLQERLDTFRSDYGF